MLSGKWRTQVLYELCKKDSCRFNELKAGIPQITNTMLTTTLRDLESKGIVHREQFNEIPPHVEYSLTEKGKDLLPIFYEIANWSKKNGYTNAIREAVSGKNTNILGEYGCFGFNTFGPFKLIGGIAKNHPNNEEIANAVSFYNNLHK